MENSVGLIDKSKAVLMVIDYQESLMSLIYENEAIIANANKLIKGAKILGVPTLVTEQYPKGLGHTCTEIELPSDQEIIEKISFSCMLSNKVTAALKDLGARLDLNKHERVWRIFFYEKHDDTAVDQIHGLSSLKELWLLHTRVTSEAAEKVRERLEGVTVYYG